MSRHFLVALLLGSALGCGGELLEPAVQESSGAERLLELGPGLVNNLGVRRDALEASLVDPNNGYSQLRLAHYGRDWEDLPERNFEVRAVTEGDFGSFNNDLLRASAGDFDRVFESGEFEWTDEYLRDLGRRAFHNYPLELTNRFGVAMETPEAADEFGLWRDGTRVGGLVRARLGNGSEMFATTCATCHASMVDGVLEDGRANAEVDHGAMSRRMAGGAGSPWWPGAVDVTPDRVDNPVAITDLRSIAHQKRLHWAATLFNSPEALAVRVETLMITSANQSQRPPREVAVAIAYYLLSLGEAEREPDETLPGAATFARECASCHGTLDAVPIASVGTDPLVGDSTMRGTGAYRVPSLYKVGSRTQFLHQGLVKSLDELLSATRLDEVPGHAYGTGLDDGGRADLIAYLKTL